MAKITNASKEVEVKETVKVTVTFEYELVNGQFQTEEDEAHYNKYVEYVSSEDENAEG